MRSFALLVASLLVVPELADAAGPPIVPDFGDHEVLVSSINNGGPGISSGGMLPNITHANLFWEEGSYPRLCLIVAGGSTAGTHSFRVEDIDANGKPSGTAVWEISGVSDSGTGKLCVDFTDPSATVHDASYFDATTGDLLVGGTGPAVQLWLLVERTAGAGSISYEELSSSSPGIIERRLPATGSPPAYVRGMLENSLTGVLEPKSSGIVAIYLADEV